jgi:hypothetical protein
MIRPLTDLEIEFVADAFKRYAETEADDLDALTAAGVRFREDLQSVGIIETSDGYRVVAPDATSG